MLDFLRKTMKRPIGRIIFVAILGLWTVIAIDRLTQEPAKWPFSAQDPEEISLSEAHGLITSGEALEAAIVSTDLYIAVPAEKALPTGDDAAIDATDHLASIADIPRTLMTQLPYPSGDYVARLVEGSKVPIKVLEQPWRQTTVVDRIFSILPAILIIGMLILFMRGGAVKGLGLSQAFSVANRDSLTIGFDDVAGIDAARSEIEEIVRFLKDPKGSTRLGGRMPKGALLVGPPGTGKTLLAKAMAKESGANFLSIQASSVNQLFVGAGAMKISKAFREARKMAPCIVFIDEIDAMGGKRGAGPGKNDEKDTTLNQLLVELDGFDGREGVVLIAATNQPEVLDPALIRPGRIDRRIEVGLPQISERAAIVRVHLRTVKAEAAIDADAIAGQTYGFSGAELAMLVNEAALSATRRDAATVEMCDFTTARDRMRLGLAGASNRASEDERRIVAWHEAGHALAALTQPEADPIERATIMSRGRTLGHVLQAPDRDRMLESRTRLKSLLVILASGRAAEEAAFGDENVTGGAAGDITHMTRVARSMVLKMGLSSLGMIEIDPSDPAMQPLARKAADEIQAILAEAHQSATHLMASRRAALDAIAEALHERETLDRAELIAILDATRPPHDA